MSEEFDKEKLNDTDTSSFVPQDAEAQGDYEDGMKVVDNPYQTQKEEDDDDKDEAVAVVPKPKKKKMKTVDRVIMIIAIIVFLASLGVILKTVYDVADNKKQTENIAGLVTEPAQEAKEYGDDGMLEKYRSAYNANNDLVGWIVVPNTSINHPVVQAKNNEYYLRRSFYGDYQRRGTVFMDYRDHAKPLCKNTILYGHNFLDSTMFADLEKYKDIEFYKTSPVIQFDTIYEKHKWKIISVFLTNADDKDDNGYARFVVVARLVRDGESETVDVSKTVKNDNPRYPQIWYDTHGLPNPYAFAERWFPEGVEY